MRRGCRRRRRRCRAGSGSAVLLRIPIRISIRSFPCLPPSFGCRRFAGRFRGRRRFGAFWWRFRFGREQRVVGFGVRAARRLGRRCLQRDFRGSRGFDGRRRSRRGRGGAGGIVAPGVVGAVVGETCARAVSFDHGYHLGLGRALVERRIGRHRRSDHKQRGCDEDRDPCPASHPARPHSKRRGHLFHTAGTSPGVLHR